ncbi:ABC transporter substrate-binding protein [Bordetella holmesii]|uniref:Receptor family ligand-binding protein n=2 Tax=Bordetella holmesii TaxID=35814 RepID=A0A158M923_9BORD|nr:ABC transporter substrate-binding protein [Bordetella holmesii]AHV94584.1 receptor ligand binding region family protein [Bordetella holmesii ATCC 51541]EWM44644.1 receptor ligand binding region family protein [Bordetella holmesii 70147]EXF87981.1 receptor ligand binding region family protein [Bordetella holmesii 30539]EXX93982.1 receptor ligand binding region family protein [Bordetella holmesii 1058]KAK74803.1 receptor family ligand-binding protein [Bordetella holmesii H620]KAK83781.1 rece
MQGIQYAKKCLGVFATLAMVGSAVAADTPLRLGFIESITGPGAAYGEAHFKGTRLAVDMINADGGVNGKPIEIFAEDDKSDPTVGINSAKKLITQRKVNVMAGSSASLVTIAFSRENEKAKVPLVVGVAGSPTITKQGYQHVWRVNVTDNQLDLKAVEHFFKDGGKRRFAFLAENSDYGKPPTKSSADYIRSLGGEVVAYEEYNRGETDFKAQLSNIRKQNPEVLLVHGYYTEGSIIARQVKELGINAQLIVNMGQGVPKFAELAGAAAEGVVFPTNWAEGADPRHAPFEKAFKEKYGVNASAFDAAAYAAVQTIAEAARRGGGNGSADIQKGLPMLIGFETLLGPIQWDAANQNDGKVLLAKFERGQIIPAK